MDQISKIIILGTYFGRWPVWFPAFLLSCAKNKTINWLFFTDCEIPTAQYSNIKFKQMSLEQLNMLASRQLGFKVEKDSYSQLNLRPAYGIIFEEYIRGFDFWGHCDFDIVWGDIRCFITDEILQKSDIVSCRKDFLAGHLTLWRNNPQINTLFRVVPSYKRIFASREHYGFDEPIMSTFLKTLIGKETNSVRVYWSEEMVVWYHGSITPIGWYWENGKVFDSNHQEYIYMHFQHWNQLAWKRAVTSIDFRVGEKPSRFKFTPYGIRSRQVSILEMLYEKFNHKTVFSSLNKIFRQGIRSLRFLKRLLVVRNSFWSEKLTANNIDEKDVQYEQKTGNLSLRHLELQIGRQHDFLLEGYYAALQLKDQRKARFYMDSVDKLIVDIAGLKFRIGSIEEITDLKQLFVDGKYNILFPSPVVVLDIGMNAGLSSIYFANQSDTIVVGYEPYKEAYEQALYNISLNPVLISKIHPNRAGVGDMEFKTIAHSFPKTISNSGMFSRDSANRMGPKFEYEEVEIKDVAQILDSIVADYPGRGIILKIDFRHPKYHIDGLWEHAIINRLHSAGKLGCIDTIMLKWHKRNPDHNLPNIAHSLLGYGFKIFLLSPYDPHQGILYAVQGNTQMLRSNNPLMEKNN